MMSRRLKGIIDDICREKGEYTAYDIFDAMFDRQRKNSSGVVGGNYRYQATAVSHDQIAAYLSHHRLKHFQTRVPNHNCTPGRRYCAKYRWIGDKKEATE